MSPVIDPLRRTRLRWRARRGLLENDLILTRFLDRYQDQMTDADVAGFDQLLELTDNDLLDLLLNRKPLAAQDSSEDSKRVLAWLQSV